MFTANQIVAHLVGDYLLQSDWMAREKHRRFDAAVVHVLFYILPFVLITREPLALGLIAVMHLIIDHFGVARYLAWLKNRPWPGSRPWSQCRESGFPPDMPVWQSNWLLVIIDNTLHILTNGIVLFYFG